MGTAEARLSELALRWEELRELGRAVSAEELCAGCPELLDDLKGRIAELQAMSRLLVDETNSATATTEPGSPPQPVGPTAPRPADFEILGELGHGGMGVVYRAYDRNRGSVVALKTMQRVDPSALDRFKKEFRAAADLVHPNLVGLHELVWDGQVWFFTMDLVEGVNFLAYVRGEAGDDAPDPGVGLSPPQVERLRGALGQLAEGVSALHAAGTLHRDIKPSNVLVRADGRAVLLDFGLAAQLGATGLHRSTDRFVRGTLAYMSPEQASALPLSPASDWYSVGVMLYEALTGRLPYPGPGELISAVRRRAGPPRPSSLAVGVPDDLDSLCLDLLQHEPGARPIGAEVMRRLGGCRVTDTTAPAALAPLIGRERHLEAVGEAFAASSRGRTVVVRIQGPSGAGKSALVQWFLDGLTTRDAAVVLAGRCFERESVPYKALDSLIDALGRYLRHLSRHEAEALMPRDVLSLARVFPALRRVEAVAAAPRRGFEIPDQQELRRRAFAALRELLARMGDRRPLVLAIDDLQWGDIDSAAVLTELLRGPAPPELLLIACHRSEDVATSPFLRALQTLRDQADPAVDWREMTVEALPPAEARRLAEALLDRDGPTAQAHSEAIARESGGNPFFVIELVRSIQSGEGMAGHVNTSGEVALDEVLWARILRLPGSARRLLEIVAVSGRPLRLADACLCAELTADDRASLAVLRSGRLIRTTAPAEREEIETYHDRVRETVVARLPADVLRDHHRRLAGVLETSGIADPESLGVHFLGAGEPAKAGVYFAEAAARAAKALAFDRAATLYRLALEVRPLEGTEGRAVRKQLGDALANAGRGAEAAHEYLAAAPGATVAEAFELRKLAAMQLLISGRIDAGLTALREVLVAVGMALPATPRRAFASLLVGRARLLLRGLEFRRRDPSQIAATDLARIDVCWAAVVGLSVVDFIRGADFQARGLLLALRAGEPFRIARALAMEASHAATAGGPSRHRTDRLLRMAGALADEVGHPYARGMTDLGAGTAAYLEGRWRDALEACDRAERTFLERCTGVAWELATAHAFALWSLSHLGELAELRRRWPVLLKQASERGDLYEVMNLNTYLMSVVRLAADDPEGARDELRRNMGRWSRTGYHVQHNDELWATTQIDLYRGDGAAAWAHLSATWPALSRSMLLRVQFIRIAMRHLRARCALAAAVVSGPRHFLREAEREAGRLERESMPWADAFAQLLRASLLAARGDKAGAGARLANAERALEAVDMRLYATAARRRRGQLLGGTSGDALIADADARMAEQGVRDPARMTAVYTPGFPG